MLAVGAVALIMLIDPEAARSVIGLPRGIVMLARFVTDFGTSLYMFVVSALVAVAAVLARRRGRGRRVDAGLAAIAERAIFVFATVAGSGTAAQIAKHLVGRARPRFLETLGPYHFDFLAFQAKHNSFPSGHTANAVAAAVALGIVWPRGRLWLLAAAATVAVSRVVVRAHYPSDTAAGALLGCACAFGVGLLFAQRGIALRRVNGRLVGRGRRAVEVALADVFGRRRRSGVRR